MTPEPKKTFHCDLRTPAPSWQPCFKPRSRRLKDRWEDGVLGLEASVFLDSEMRGLSKITYSLRLAVF